MGKADDSRLLDRYKLLMEAVRHPAMTKVDVAVLGQILAHANHREGFAAWPSVQAMAEALKTSKRSVIRGIEGCELLGFIEVEKRAGSTSTYYPLLDRSRGESGDIAVTTTRDTDVTGLDDFDLPPVTNLSRAGDIPVQIPPLTGDIPVTYNSFKKSNSFKNTGQSSSSTEDQQQGHGQEQNQERDRLQEEAKRRHGFREEYLAARSTHPAWARRMESSQVIRGYIEDLIEEKAA